MFKNGDIIKRGTKDYLEWTVLDYEESLLGCRQFEGHSGADESYKGTVWEDHCWYVPKADWRTAPPLVEENE